MSSGEERLAGDEQSSGVNEDEEVWDEEWRQRGKETSVQGRVSFKSQRN